MKVRDLKIAVVSVAGLAIMSLAASALAAGSDQVSTAAPTPCITPSGAIYSTNCDGVGGGKGSPVGDTTSVPSVTDPATTAVTPAPTVSASPSLTPGVIPAPQATVTPTTDGGQGGGGSNLPDTGAMTAVSSAIGLGAIGYAGRMYWKRRQLANEPVRPMRAPSDPETLDIASISA